HSLNPTEPTAGAISSRPTTEGNGNLMLNAPEANDFKAFPIHQGLEDIGDERLAAISMAATMTFMAAGAIAGHGDRGGNVSEILSQTELDSFDQWNWLAEGEGPVGDYAIREEMLYNIDENIPTAAIRIGKWKYITGPQTINNLIVNISLNGWFGDSGRLNLTTQEDLDAYNDVLEWTSQMNLAGQILSRKGWLPSEEIMQELREAAEVQCNDAGSGGFCDPGVAPCLFDIEADPCEKNNLLASDQGLCDPESGLECEEVAEMLRNRIGYFEENVMIPSVLDGTRRDPRANPDLHGGFWTNWMDFDRSRNQN
ncbi:unnamed protein product, partial [Cyprideis torosa]